MSGFDQFNLTPEIRQSIAALGFEVPTPVQSAVIPVLLEGRRNMVALAQTGTGKTAAFGIPVLQRVDTGLNTVQAVVLCPTRELCLQVCRDLKSFAKHTKALRSVAIYGGASIETQIRALRNGVHIIVATPGRLHDILRRRAADLSTASCVVLDEADEMLSMGFEEDLKAIMGAIPDTVQKLLFSATMPRQVENLTAAYMHDPVEITIGSRNAGAENVVHECYMIHEKDRYLALKRIVDASPSIYALIFCRTRVETQETAEKLIKDGYSADALHGELSQIQRDRVMQSFRDRSISMLVATDVAARGLDINDLTHVINYQLPDELESYTHRSGRTGRAGKSGISAVLINMREKWKIQHIERRLGKRFAFKAVPSGRAVCEAQLLQLIARVKSVSVNESQIESYLPQVFEMLEGLSREALIKHFVSLELNRFLDYYRGAPDISVPPPSPPPPDRRRGAMPRREPPRFERGQPSRDRYPRPVRNPSDEGRPRFVKDTSSKPRFAKKTDGTSAPVGSPAGNPQREPRRETVQKMPRTRTADAPVPVNKKDDATPVWARNIKKKK